MIDQLDAIQTKRLRLRAEGRATFAVQRQGEAIGRVGFRSAAERAPEARIWIAQTHRGQGFATEALKAALAWARHSWGRRYVAAGHHLADAAMARVLIKAGFLYTGVVAPREAGEPVRMMVWLA